MTEQEAIDLIATKLMGWENRKYNSIDLWIRLTGEFTGYYYYSASLEHEYRKDVFNPFHDSNHARMVKDALVNRDLFICGYVDPIKEDSTISAYTSNLSKRLKLPLDPAAWSSFDRFLYHNAPNPDCMWSVVDVLLAMKGNSHDENK